MLDTLIWALTGTGPLAAVRLFIDTGGPVLLLVGLAGALLWTLILERWWFFRFVLPRLRRETVAQWRARDNRASWAARRVRETLIRSLQARMNATLPMMRMLVAACPLLGLLGTVTGMIAVFDVVALVGTGDAQAMAAGVSRATIPTMAGMVVGISGLFPLYRFTARARMETEKLSDQLDTRGGRREEALS